MVARKLGSWRHAIVVFDSFGWSPLRHKVIGKSRIDCVCFEGPCPVWIWILTACTMCLSTINWQLIGDSILFHDCLKGLIYEGIYKPKPPYQIIFTFYPCVFYISSLFYSQCFFFIQSNKTSNYFPDTVINVKAVMLAGMNHTRSTFSLIARDKIRIYNPYVMCYIMFNKKSICVQYATIHLP